MSNRDKRTRYFSQRKKMVAPLLSLGTLFFSFSPILSAANTNMLATMAFSRALTIAEESCHVRPEKIRNFFELHKITKGWTSNESAQLTNPASEDSCQAAMYRYLSTNIINAANKKPDTSISVGAFPFSNDILCDQHYHDLDATFLNGHIIDFDFRPSFPIVLVNLRAAASSYIRFGVLPEDAFRYRTLDAFRKNAALLNSWGVREHVTLFTLPVGKRVIGKFGLVGPQNSHSIRSGLGRIRSTDDYLIFLKAFSKDFWTKPARREIAKATMENFNGGGVQFYIHSAEESHTYDLGNIHHIHDSTIKYAAQKSLFDLLEEAEKNKNFALQDQLVKYRENRFTNTLPKQCSAKDRRKKLLELSKRSYLFIHPKNRNPESSENIHFLDKDYGARKIHLETLMLKNEIIDVEIWKVIQETLQEEGVPTSSS